MDNERYPVSKGDIINNANAPYDEDPGSNNNLNMYCIMIADFQIEGLPPNCLLSPGALPVFSAEEHADKVETLMSMIYVMLATEPEACAEACHYLTAALLAQLLMLTRRESFQKGKNHTRTNHDIIAARVKIILTATMTNILL